MTPGRRTLHFSSFDDVMADVDRLLQGHTTVGTWSLAQICRHLATIARRVVDLPASTPSDPSQWVDEEQKQKVFESGNIPEGLPCPPDLIPPGDLDERVEAENFRQAIAYFQASSGPVIPHRFFGPLSREEWHQLQRTHCAHHLSFVVPTASPTRVVEDVTEK